jgi:hypothetical protein
VAARVVIPSFEEQENIAHGRFIRSL